MKVKGVPFNDSEALDLFQDLVESLVTHTVSQRISLGIILGTEYGFVKAKATEFAKSLGEEKSSANIVVAAYGATLSSVSKIVKMDEVVQNAILSAEKLYDEKLEEIFARQGEDAT
jgi:hypothetical protein